MDKSTIKATIQAATDIVTDTFKDNINPRYACKFYNLPSKDICDKRYPIIEQHKGFNYYYGYFSTFIILMQNQYIVNIVKRNWALIIIIGAAIWEMTNSLEN